MFSFIDALRGAAALLVVVYHVIEISGWKTFPVEGAGLTFRIGWIGVDLFFVISGFVIAHSALRDYKRDRNGFGRRFMRRRLARIVPLYLLTGLAFLFLVSPQMLVAPFYLTSVHVLTHLLFIHNLHPGTFGSINGPNWSVALEMQFYIFMLLITPWLSRRGILALFPLALLAISYRYLTTLILVPGTSSDTHFQHVLSCQLPGTLDEFAVGIGLAMIINGRNESLRKYLLVNWKNFGAWLLLGIVMMTATMAIFWPRAGYWDNQYMITAWRTLLGMSLGCLVAAAVTFPAANWDIFKPVRYVGEISYGIYLWHLPVLLTLVAIPGLTEAKLLAWVLTGTLLLASFSWHWFEKPIIERHRVPGLLPGR